MRSTLVAVVVVTRYFFCKYFEKDIEQSLAKFPVEIHQFPINFRLQLLLRTCRFLREFFLSGIALDDVLHTQKYFPKLIKSNRNQIVFTIQRLIWN